MAERRHHDHLRGTRQPAFRFILFGEPRQRGDNLHQPPEHGDDAHNLLLVRQHQRRDCDECRRVRLMDAALIAGQPDPQRHQWHLHHHLHIHAFSSHVSILLSIENICSLSDHSIYYALCSTDTNINMIEPSESRVICVGMYFENLLKLWGEE